MSKSPLILIIYATESKTQYNSNKQMILLGNIKRAMLCTFIMSIKLCINDDVLSYSDKSSLVSNLIYILSTQCFIDIRNKKSDTHRDIQKRKGAKIHIGTSFLQKRGEKGLLSMKLE